MVHFIGLGFTDERDKLDLPPFASVWMVDDRLWWEALECEGFIMRMDRKSHPGVSCINYDRVGGHSKVRLLFGSSSNANRKRRELLAVFSPLKDDPFHYTYFGAYDCITKTLFSWCNDKKLKRIRQTSTSENIKVEPDKLQAYLDRFMTF